MNKVCCVAYLLGSLPLAMCPLDSFAQANESLLRARMEIWIRQAPLCDGHPTKLFEDGDPNCSDGDMNLFSGLLCSAGVKDSKGNLIGCLATAAAQDTDGRWHRSPRRRLDPTIAEKEKAANVASFSPDMALGTQLYLLAAKDAIRGERWLKWLDDHRPCWAGQEPTCDFAIGQIKLKSNVRGLPRFCTDEPGPPQPDESDADKALRALRIDPRCSMRPGDLAVLARTREALKIYNFTNEDSTACSVSPPTNWNEAKQRFDNLEKLLNLTNFNNLASIVEGGLPYTLRLTCPQASSWTRLGAEFNKPGYSEHLVAVQILLLRMIAQDDSLLRESALRLAAKEPENPFFIFLKEGKSQGALEKVLQHCPKDESESTKSKKSQWMWERTFGDDWKERSSLWDCIFVGQLWINGK